MPKQVVKRRRMGFYDDVVGFLTRSLFNFARERTLKWVRDKLRGYIPGPIAPRLFDEDTMHNFHRGEMNILDFRIRTALTDRLRLSPVIHVGNGYVQCTFIQMIRVLDMSSATNTILMGIGETTVVPEAPGSIAGALGMDRNQMFLFQRSVLTNVGELTNSQKDFVINRIFPFSEIGFRQTASNSVDVQLIAMPIRIKASELWQNILDQYHIDIPTFFPNLDLTYFGDLMSLGQFQV